MYVKAAAKFRKRLKKERMARLEVHVRKDDVIRLPASRGPYCANISALVKDWKALLATVAKGWPTRSERRKMIEEIEDVSLYLSVR